MLIISEVLIINLYEVSNLGKGYITYLKYFLAIALSSFSLSSKR